MPFFKDLSLSAFTAGFVAVLVGFTSSVAIVFQAAQAFGATPVQIPKRGKTNEPALVTVVVNGLAAATGRAIEEIEAATWASAAVAFGL